MGEAISHNQDLEGVTLDKILEGEESRTRKRIEIAQTQELNRELTARILQVIDSFLDVFTNKQFIIAPKNAANLTERDYESLIWTPLFTKLYAVRKVPLVRIKAGESVNDESTKKKAEQYSTAKNIIWFKVDLRFIYDHADLEVDLVNLEACLPSADRVKINHDDSKLLRESMISTEVIHHMLSHEDFIYTWNVRALSFPTCVSELKDLEEDLTLLFRFKEDVENIASKVKRGLNKTERRRGSNRDYSPVRKPAPVPSTYFTPPRKEAQRSLLPFYKQ